MTAPATRLLGAVVSWWLLTLCLTLLFHATWALVGVGGSCASGGPYQIEVECPPAVALFMPLSIFGGFLAVGISLVFARGFGTPMLPLAWSVLFCGLGVTFFAGFAMEVADWSWIVVGVVFEAMGLAPLVFALVADPRAVLIGTTSVGGAPFTLIGTRRTWIPRLQRADDPVDPTARDWLLAIGTTLVAVALGIWAGDALFSAVAEVRPR
jgi:hypothetical protein